MSDDESQNSKGDMKSHLNGDGSVCRDFLRNVCRRGALCKYKHPEGQQIGETGGNVGNKKMEYNFCHDYQNRECRRPNCKFLHCTRQEEQEFLTTGELPKRVINGSAGKSNSGGEGLPGKGGGSDVPVCKDYLKGDCRRGGRCKFRHINEPEFDPGDGSRGRRDRFDRFDRFNAFDNFEPEPKRRAFDDPYGRPPLLMGGPGNAGSGAGDSIGMLGHHPAFGGPDFRMIEEENMLLRRKIDDMKQKIVELTATNEFLLNQNAQLRITKQNAMATVGPSMSSMSGMSAGNPMASMTQLSMNSGDLTASRMASELAGSMGVPVTMGQGMAPVSMAPGSMGPMPSVSLAPSMMTMSTPSTNLVSYPIMTQSMRPMQHTMGH